MSRSPSARRSTGGVIVGVGLTAALSACRAPHGQEPRVDIGSWSLEDIEAELDRNGEVLADAGIMVAMAEGADATQKAEGLQDGGGGDDGTPDVDEMGEADDGEDLAEPEPAPETMPTSASPIDREHELAVADEAPRSVLRRSRRSSQSERRAEPSRCVRVCDLADATCDLEAQICDLATRHPEEERYHLACERAELQCDAAIQACERCEE